MHGVELDDVDTELSQDEFDSSLCQDDEEEEEGHCCSGCMDCLGFSWNDFI